VIEIKLYYFVEYMATFIERWTGEPGGARGSEWNCTKIMYYNKKIESCIALVSERAGHSKIKSMCRRKRIINRIKLNLRRVRNLLLLEYPMLN
jgi:hypothetical protein